MFPRIIESMVEYHLNFQNYKQTMVPKYTSAFGLIAFLAFAAVNAEDAEVVIRPGRSLSTKHFKVRNTSLLLQKNKILFSFFLIIFFHNI